jgi:hypothetical protein
VQNIFQIIIIDVFDDGESIGNAFFTTTKFFFYQNHIIRDCTILFSYVITLAGHGSLSRAAIRVEINIS